jgi:LPS sulfotransferase NodH
MHQIAARLGCALPDRRINIVRYVSLLETKRTRNGVFGTKLQPDQLKTISVQDIAAARAWLSRFDRIVLLRRQDKLLQAISLTRAHLTNQWQLYGDDRQIPIGCRDDVLFPMIADRLGKIHQDERFMMALTAGLDPRSVRLAWYEELSQPAALAATAEWLWTAAGHGKLPPEPRGGQRLPLKMDDSEARAIKARFLAAAGAER